MISVVIPAFREAERIGATVAAIRQATQEIGEPVEVIVIDDGSDDGTAEQAEEADRVLRLEKNQGKGAALARGLVEARGEWIVMLDADLGETAANYPKLLAPVRAGEADMTIAVFPGVPEIRYSNKDGRDAQDGSGGRPLSSHPVHPCEYVGTPERLNAGGFGLALRTARWGVARLTGRVLQAPLSGQRAFRADHLPVLTPLEPGFGLEVGLDIDALRAGLRVLEVPTTMRHAATGRDWAGFCHRGRQFAHILRALARRIVRRRRSAPE